MRPGSDGNPRFHSLLCPEPSSCQKLSSFSTSEAVRPFSLSFQVLLESPFLLSAQVHPIDIPQLCNEPKAAEPEPPTQDGTHWTSSQSPIGYCNQPLKIRTASHLSVDSAPFSLSSSSCRGDLQNPSYNLKVWSEDRNSGSEQQLLDASASPTSSGQYKPQTDMEVFRPHPLREESQGCIPCDSDYISLPR